MGDRLDDVYHIVEFYRSGEHKPIARRSGMRLIPCIGHGIEVCGVMGEVVSITWNMDYAGRPHEQWRCNVYIKEADDAD